MTLLLNVEVLYGSGLRPIIAEALQLSRKLDITIGMVFNGIKLEVKPNSSPDELVDKWEKENQRRASIPSQW